MYCLNRFSFVTRTRHDGHDEFLNWEVMIYLTKDKLVHDSVTEIILFYLGYTQVAKTRRSFAPTNIEKIVKPFRFSKLRSPNVDRVLRVASEIKYFGSIFTIVLSLYVA